jgi:hypothetical protein
LIGRLPESWIPPGHILDLRARVRTCHLLSHQRSGSSGGTRCSTTMGSRNDTTCSHSRTAMDRWPEAPGRRPRAARPRASDHRRARHPARSVRLRAPRDRTQAAGLSSEALDRRRAGAMGFVFADAQAYFGTRPGLARGRRHDV